MGGGAGGSPTPPSATVQAMETIAPIPPTPPLGAPGSTIYKYRITWEAVLRPEAPTAEGKS